MILKRYKNFSRFVVALLVLLVPLSVLADNNSSATVENKSEIVYAKLSSTGQVEAAYVVNRFVLASSGQVTDYGPYDTVINLTDTAVLDRQADAVTFTAQAGNFYYQGNIPSAELPWDVTVSYLLEGEPVSPQALAGADGALTIHVEIALNEKVDTTFYENYLMQISISLNSETCKDIVSEGATVAISGTDMVYNYTVLPGNDADITLYSTVQNFEMQGIDISAIPYSMDFDIPDTDEMIDNFEDLSDAISDLNSGVGVLTDGVAQITTAGDVIQSGSSDINSGLSLLSANGAQIAAASSQINTSLAQISAMINGSGSNFSLSDLSQLPGGLSTLSQGLSDISSALTALKSGYQSAFQALDAAISAIPDSSLTDSQISELYTYTDASQYDVLDELVANYQAAQTVKGTYASVKDAFSAVGPTLDTIITNLSTMADTLNTMSTEIDSALTSGGLDQLDQLAAGLSALSQNYSDFHNGLDAYTTGVSDISTGYTDFHSGLKQFLSGIDDLYSGVSELYSGTKRLSSETSDMPDTLQSEIDDMLGDYTGSDFEPISYASSKNSNINLVQFVFKCDGIEKTDSAETPEVSTEAETVWDRLTSLFEER